LNWQKRNILIRIFLLAAFILVISCENSKKPVETAFTSDSGGEIPDNRIWNMDVTVTSEGNIRAKLKAGYVERENFGNSRYTLSHIDSGLFIEFYEHNKITGILNSRKGTINDLSEIFTALDEVVFNSNNGYTLYTDTLVWDRKKAQIYTESDVMMVKDNRDTLYGKGFITDDKFEAYEIKKPRGETIIEEKKF